MISGLQPVDSTRPRPWSSSLSSGFDRVGANVGAEIIAYTILGVPCYM